MPTLNKTRFKGGGDLPTERITTLCTRSDSDSVKTTLTKLGWEGNIIAGVTLRVSTDGSKVDNGQFFLAGNLVSQNIVIQTAKLWAKANKEVTLSLKIPNGDKFNFMSGTLASEYKDQGDLEFSYSSSAGALEPDKWEENGLCRFSIRVICHLGKSSNTPTGPHIKYTVLAFPHDADQLTRLSDRTQSSSWPGIKILEGQCGFFPIAPDGYWGTPFLPLLNTENRSNNSSSWPSGDNLRYAIAGIMRTAALPTACTSFAGLSSQAKKILKNRTAADPKEPTVTWPEQALPATTQGKQSLILNLTNLEGTIKSSRELSTSKLSHRTRKSGSIFYILILIYF